MRPRRFKSSKKLDPHEPYCGKPLMAEVINGNIEKALQELKQKLKDDKRFLTIYNNTYYEKPSEKRRRKKHLGMLREKFRREDRDK